MQNPSNPNDQELKDALLQVEGTALLNSISHQTAPEPAGLVDPTGAPLGKPETKSRVEMSPQAAYEMRRRQADEQLEARRLASAKAISPILEESPRHAKLRDIMCLAHKMLSWCRMELAGHPDITDDMINDLEYILHRQIYESQGFDFKVMLSQLKNYAVKTMTDFQSEYVDAGRVKRMHIEKINKKLGGKGIPLPPDMQAILGKKFGPGMTIILRGDSNSTHAALRYLLGMFKPFGNVYLAQSEGCRGTPFAHVVPLPSSWWANAASTLSSLLNAFEPVCKAESLLLAVQDVDTLFTSDETMHPLMRKSLAIKRMYQWGVENMVALILCDNDTAVVDRERPYGFIPFVQVSLTGKTLYIGKDTFDTEVI